jgi:hypothetical protein
LTRWLDALQSGNKNQDNAWDYAKYFSVKETLKHSRKVTPKEETVNAAQSKYSGFFRIITPKKMDPIEAFNYYRADKLWKTASTTSRTPLT